MFFKGNDPTQLQLDKDALRKFGYIQELNRSMSPFGNFAISFSIISVLTGLNSLYGYGLANGGIASIWTLPFVGICQLTVALALAEIASLYPIAGGVYKWTSIFSNRLAGWFCGWISLIGWTACLAGAEYGLAQFFASFFGLAPGNNMTILMFIVGTILLHTIINLYGLKILKFCCDSSVVVHLVGVFLITVLMLLFGRENTMQDLTISNVLNHGYSWGGLMATILLSTWTLTGFDASANVSEESINPSRSVPQGMIMSVATSTVLGTLYLLSIGLATTDIPAILNSGQPATIYVIQQVLGPVVSRYVVIIVIYAMFVCALSIQALLIRKLYALSRDNLLPWSNVWKIVSPKYAIPHFAGMLSGILPLVLCCAVMLLPIDALPMIASLSTLGIYSSHTIAIAVSTSPLHRNQKGSFSLRGASMPIKLIACTWQLFICGIVFYFNFYSGLLLIILMSAVLLYYYVSGRENLETEAITLTEEDLIRIEDMRGFHREDER